MENKEIENTTNEQSTEQKETTLQPEQQQKSEAEITAEKIAELELQVASLKDQLLRKAAEFENYKRRSEQNAVSFAKYASENVITELLPIIDDLSRSLKSGIEKS